MTRPEDATPTKHPPRKAPQRVQKVDVGGADKLVMRKGREERVANGYPWVFSGEVYQVPPPEMDGQIMPVEDARGRLLGLGMINTKSNIVLRVLTRQREPVDRDFFKRRLTEAIAYRERYAKLDPSPNAGYRLIHAEADGLPALIVDRYGSFLVVQALALGIAERMPMIVELLAELTGCKGIYERSDVLVRNLEGLPQATGVLYGEAPPADLVIEEHGSKFRVDVATGQKTGFFLDQRLNRQRVRELARGRVLNTFCYTGGFSIAAALGGAEEVVSVDISADAIALAEENARLNGVEAKCTWQAANAFDALREYEKAGEKFDVVILDPPAFTKNKDSVPGAVRGYKEINLRALRLLNPGGLLVTSSCSHHISPAL
ncbi:MAG: methyltransferase small, partial [Cyanobacteria bacterium RYN_339]|nr:methyltransferase small [Cyanobacteria bacterium RYN_339]